MVEPDGVAEAARLLDDLEATGTDRPLPEHVEVFDAVHRALADTLAQAER